MRRLIPLALLALPLAACAGGAAYSDVTTTATVPVVIHTAPLDEQLCREYLLDVLAVMHEDYIQSPYNSWLDNVTEAIQYEAGKAEDANPDDPYAWAYSAEAQIYDSCGDTPNGGLNGVPGNAVQDAIVAAGPQVTYEQQP